jgi:DNA ligase-1
MKFPKLYSKSLTGKILEWTIEVEGDSYRTIAGQQDGKKVTSEWSKCEAKNVGRSNATTGEEQAKLEAEALWKKKIKSHGYWEKVEDVDGSKFIEPMLAKKLIDRENKVDFSKGIIVQIKLNGLRCVATKDGLFSRKGERFISVPHIENDLKEWFKTNPNAVLDGELFNYDYRQCLNEIVKLCRKTKDVNQEDLDRSEKLVKYYVYDGYGFDGMNEFVPYQKRKLYIDTNLPKFTKFYGPVKDFFVTSRTELDKIFESFLQDGQEGAMVRIPDSPYEHKRSNNLLKHKPIEDAEFKILDILPGTGNWAGKARVIKLKDGNDTFKADFKGSMEEAREMFDNKSQYIGKTVRIFFFGKTGLGTPNYAKFDYDNWKL